MNTVAVIGLGRIGLPTALILKKCGFAVIGVDTNARHLEAIRSKTFHSDEREIQSLFESVDLPVFDTPLPAEIFLICVPTPLTEDKKADLSHVQHAISQVHPHVKKGSLVIIESTCPIGTTDAFARQFPDVYFAYCPERVLPGAILKELVGGNRVVGGVTEEATRLAVAFYSRFCQGDIYTTRAAMAEAVKLCENAYRDVNIALANEVSMIAEALGLSCREMIALANCHPRVAILQPGPGVGGHCIPVDPHFLIEALPEETVLLQAARKVNEEKRAWVENAIERIAQKRGCKTIAIFGLTYKPNSSDFRHSPALKIYESLKKRYHVLPVDPFYPEGVSLEEGIAQADMLIGLVAHDMFGAITRASLKEKVILDYGGVFS